MVSRVNDVDEFEYFANNFKRVYALNPQYLNEVVQQGISAKLQAFLKVLLNSKRVQLYGPASDEKGSEMEPELS